MTSARRRKSWPSGLLLLPLSVALSSIYAQESLRPQSQAKGATGKSFSSHCVSPAQYQHWLDEDVRWIITDDERAQYTRLATDDQRDAFIEAFWQRRNPTPGPENPYKEEHYRRIAYTNTHFAARVPGWKTDRGRFYIMYGSPTKIERARPGDQPADMHSGDVQFDRELWRWDHIEGLGENVTLEFVDSCGCGEYPLRIDQKDLKKYMPK